MGGVRVLESETTRRAPLKLKDQPTEHQQEATTSSTQTAEEEEREEKQENFFFLPSEQKKKKKVDVFVKDLMAAAS